MQTDGHHTAVSHSVEQWLERFRELDAEEEEDIDQGPGYRALLGGQGVAPWPASGAEPGDST